MFLLTLFVWFLIAFLLGFWLWSIYVVLRQKRAWRVYADKRKLRYHEKGLLETPSVSGIVDDYGVSLFASQHGELDGRSQKFLTAIEVTLHTSLPTSCVVASGGMVTVAETTGIPYEFKPVQRGWDDSYAVRAQNLGMVRTYLDEGRLGKLISLMRVDKVWVIFLFLNSKGILRVDTPLPMESPKQIDLLIKQMINVAKALELKSGEDKALLRKQSKSDGAREALDIDEDLLDDNLGLELEEDE